MVFLEEVNEGGRFHLLSDEQPVLFTPYIFTPSLAAAAAVPDTTSLHCETKTGVNC
jgi:hypothetical protein